MAKRNSVKAKKSSSNITDAQIKIFVAILGFIGVLGAAYFNYLGQRVPIELSQSTQTAEARILTLAAPSTKLPNTITAVASNNALTPTKSTSPSVNVSTATTLDSLPIGQDIKNNCIGKNWTPYTTSKNRSQNLAVKDGCYQLLELGISPEKGKLLFSQQDPTEGIVNGIVGNISQTITAEIEVDIEKLSNAEIKIGILSAKAPSSFLNGKLLVVYENGTIAIREITNGDEKIASPLYVYTASCPPRIYNFRFELTNLRLNISRYNGRCKDGSPMFFKSYNYVDIPFENRFLFVGYGINQKGVVSANIVVEQK